MDSDFEPGLVNYAKGEDKEEFFVKSHVRVGHLVLSYAQYGNNAFAAPYAINQDWTVKKQLEEGIRFFDVRFRPFKTSFTVHHGPVWQKKYGGDVFKEFTDFLKQNPRETVLFSYQDESKGPHLSPEPGSHSFKNILRRYLNNNDYKNNILIDGFNQITKCEPLN